MDEQARILKQPPYQTLYSEGIGKIDSMRKCVNINVVRSLKSRRQISVKLNLSKYTRTVSFIYMDDIFSAHLSFTGNENAVSGIPRKA